MEKRLHFGQMEAGEPQLAPTGPVTLGDLIFEDKLLRVYCRECGHERDVNPATVPLPA